MYLQCGQFLLEGQLPYRDFQELNPPLIMYLSTLPAALSALSGLSLAVCGALTTACYSGLALYLTYMCLQTLFKADPPDELMRPLTAASLLAPPLTNAVAAFDYGQREHLYALFLLPYVLLRFGRYFQNADSQASATIQFLPQKWLAILIGVIFGLTICFKPHFLLLPGALELYWLARYRTGKNLIQPETLSALVAPIIYGAHFFFLPTDVRQLFLKETAPLIVRAYACFNMIKDTVVKLVWSIALSAYFVAMLLAAFLPTRLQIKAPLLILVSLSLAIIELQQKFWNYHGIPLHFWTTFTIIFSLTYFLALRAGGDKLRAAFIVICSGIFLSLNILFHDSVFAHMQKPWEPVLEKTASKGDKVLLLDSSDTPWFPTALRFGLRPGSHYLWLFAVPMREYQSKTAKSESEGREAQDKINQIFSDIHSDEQRLKPKFVMVRRNDAFGMDAIKYPDFATYVDEHGMGNILKDFVVINESSEYRLYQRKEVK